MKSSNLKHFISIERSKVGKNSDGIPLDQWTEILNTRAKIINVEGSETEKDQGTPYRIEIHIRFNPSILIEDTDRIKFKDKYFNITFMDNLENKNKWLILKGVCMK